MSPWWTLADVLGILILFFGGLRECALGNVWGVIPVWLAANFIFAFAIAHNPRRQR